MKKTIARASLRTEWTRSSVFFARLDEADEPQKMNLPGFQLHPLTGDMNKFWAVSVSGNWRIIFRFEAGHARDVDLIDYH